MSPTPPPPAAPAALANPDTFLASIPPPAAIGTEARVCEDIAARQRLGIAKYGTTVEDNPLPLDRWLKHAYEEALDMAVYLRRAMEEKAAIQQKLAAREEDLTYAYGRIREYEHERDVLVTGKKPSEFAYASVEEFEGIVGYSVNQGFRDAWRMARTTKAQLGISEEVAP